MLTVCSLRNQHRIAIFRAGERAERGEVTMEEAAVALAVSTSTVRRMVSCGVLPAHPFCKGAPWIIRQEDLGCDEVRRDADARRWRRPPPDDPRQNQLDL